MALSVHITITGDKEAIGRLGKLGTSLLNFQGAMRSIGKELPSYFSNQVMNSQGGAIGERWPALSPATRLQKSKLYPGAGPLVRTGQMKNSFGADYPDSNTAVIGNSAPYFVYHQSKLARRKLPRRAMMSTSGAVKDIIKDIIDADIRNKIAGAGL